MNILYLELKSMLPFLLFLDQRMQIEDQNNAVLFFNRRRIVYNEFVPSQQTVDQVFYKNSQQGSSKQIDLSHVTLFFTEILNLFLYFSSESPEFSFYV